MDSHLYELAQHPVTGMPSRTLYDPRNKISVDESSREGSQQ